MSSIVSLAHYSKTENVANNPIYKGVTTVWLLSSLGSARLSGPNAENSSLSCALKKKDIINVSIPSTCKAIQDNDLDLPLRHVSNLLYGVTLCYHRKTEYVLNDLTALLTQFQRKLIGPSGLRKKKTEKLGHIATIFDINGDTVTGGLLNDDPMFDINQINTFEKILNPAEGKTVPEAVIIKRQDYMKELSNSNNFDNPSIQDSSQALDRINRPLTLDDIPLDVDFNLEIDDVISQQGTSYHSKSSSQRGDHDIQICYMDQDFNLNLDENGRENDYNSKPVLKDETGIDLGIGNGNDEEASLEDESAIENGMPPLKRFKISKEMSSSFYAMIQIDERTGLSTDTLRTNHNDYCQIMDSKNQKKRKLKHPVASNWRKILDFNDHSLFLQGCWNLTLSKLEPPDLGIFAPNQEITTFNEGYSVERGRRRSRTLQSERSSSSVSSEEQGRRAIIPSKDSSTDFDNNLLLNLEQIDEELEENNSGNHSELLGINLDLPPSSFGRTNTRDNAAVGNEMKYSSSRSRELDVVDELNRQSNFRSKKNSKYDTSSMSSGDSRYYSSGQPFYRSEDQFIGPVVLDSHSRKFFDYIREKSLYIGKTTRSNPPFQKKLLFEDIVPSTLSVSGTDCDASVTDRKIAASAFLSLLSLASKDLIGIKEHEEANDLKFQLMNGDDIVVYT